MSGSQTPSIDDDENDDDSQMNPEETKEGEDEDDNWANLLDDDGTQAKDDVDINSLSDREIILKSFTKIQYLTNTVNKLVECTVRYEREKGSLIKRVNRQEVNLKTTDMKLEYQTKIIQQQQKIISDLQKRLALVEKIAEDAYCEKTRTNIVISGLGAKNENEAYHKINSVISNGKGNNLKVESIRPIAQRNKFVFKLSTSEDKSLIFSKAKFLRERGVTVEDDLPTALREDKNMLLLNRIQLFENGAAESVKIMRRGMLVDDKDWYFYDHNTKTMSKTQQKTNTKPKNKHQSSQ